MERVAHMAHMKRARLAGIEVLAEFKMRLEFVDGEVSEMGDWIQWSLTDVPTGDFMHKMYVGRVVNFYANPVIFGWSEFHKIMVAYFSAMFD